MFKRKKEDTGEDVLEGLTTVVSVKNASEIQFEGQTKISSKSWSARCR